MTKFQYYVLFLLLCIAEEARPGPAFVSSINEFMRKESPIA